MDHRYIPLVAAAALCGAALAPAPPAFAQPHPLITRTATPLPPAKEGFAYPDCYCTGSRGERVEIGERACLSINGRGVTAVCGMSLNNPAWRIEERGCPLS